ncbi:hypothetical protein C5167_007707 [Papaver somniferum]|nr:hypothetical protein C5167_007707 [Papaver somniferum]
MQKYFDCSEIQTYLLSGARVIFLNPRSGSIIKRYKDGAYCKVCDRSLTDHPNKYCCMRCKISDCEDISKDFEQKCRL